MPTSTLLPLSTQTSAAITEYGLYDYLQVDVRPAFLVPLSVSDSLGQTIDTSLAFYNISLSANEALLDRITCVLAGVLSDEDAGYGEATLFLSWILENAQTSIWFCDILWSTTDINSSWRVVSGVYLPQVTSSSKLTTTHVNHQKLKASPKFTQPHACVAYGQPTRPASENGQTVQPGPGDKQPDHSELLLSSVAKPSEHQRQVQSFDWANTELGPITTWPHALYHAVKLALACPVAVLMYWGPSRILFWNDAGAQVLRGVENVALGCSALRAFEAFWADPYELLCREVERTGRALTPTRSPGPLIERDGGLRETFWTYNYMPLLDDNGNVCGIYGLIHDDTMEIIAEGRIDTLLKVNEAMRTATDLLSFWQVTFAELEKNAADIPLAAVYSIGSEAMIDLFTGLETRQEWQTSSNVNFQDGMHPGKGWVLEGRIGFPREHRCVPSRMDFDGADGLSATFRQAMTTPKMEDVLLCAENGTLPPDFLVGCENRGLGFECTQLIAYPLQQPSGGVIAWLVLGINPRRTFDDEYKRFTQLLFRHVESKLISILTLEGERKIVLQSAEKAAYQQQQLSLQLQQQRHELEQSHARFFNFAKQAPLAIYILGGEGEVKFCNDAFYRMFDIVPGTAVPKAWLTRAHPGDLEELDRQWALAAQGFIQNRYEWRVLRPGSTSFDSEDDIVYLESCSFPEMADDGTMKSVTGLVTDVSIHKAYQREQAEKLRNALEARRVQEYFMDMVSHEMRNPLNAIIQCTEEVSQLLVRLKDKTSVNDETSTVLDEVQDMVNTTLYCGVHQKQLIDDVLTLSKLDSSLLTIYPVKVYPASLLSQAIKVFGSEIRASKVKVFHNLDEPTVTDGESSAVMVDPSRILQILINLIGNGIKFMKWREKRELHLTVHTSRERQTDGALRYFSSGNKRADPTSGAEWGTGEQVYLYFSVRDTGPGLSDPEMSSLFTRFQQASPRTHVTYGGSGLGLFISRELTELHGGEIGAVSQVDQGSTIAFYVKGRQHTSQTEVVVHDSLPPPLLQHGGADSSVNSKIPTTTPLSSSKQSTSSPALHVLVVEDNDINRKLLRRQLQKLGYQVTTASHGGEALAVLKTSTWWQGDQIQGGTQLSESRDARPHLSVILCDLEMPVMDGVTCVRHIRQWQREGLLHANIPVLAVTGNARAETTLLAAGSDFDHVVTKPYSLTSLVKRILAHTDQSIPAAA